MCLDHLMSSIPVEERPDLVGAPAAQDVSEPADIVWINRGTATTGGTGDNDGMGARFGTSAPLARAVVDAVIRAYERMIGSFNYSSPGVTYNLVVNMNSAGSGFGASANLNSTFGNKPRAGTINMGAGTNTADPNDSNGWFLDPTPDENSEFAGNIVNAYSGDAQSGSPAFNMRDFYTVVAAEMTHCMGLFGNAIPSWAALTTNTNIPDLAEAGSGNTTGARGTYWVFRGPSIKHLLTGNNGGSGGSNFGSAVHAAGPTASNQPLTFEGDIYQGAQDQGNAVYETSRRYMINNTFSLMFRDAYGYSSVDPAQFGTMYSIRNSTTNAVTVRGGSGTNDDTISVTRSGNTIFVSVDPTIDVPGTGALPGAGNLPAFVTQYDVSEVSSISIAAGAGNDSITIAADLGVTVTIDASTGTDTVKIVGTSGDDAITVNAATISAGTTTIGSLAGAEEIQIDSGDGSDVVTVTETPPTTTVSILAGAGGALDTLEINADGIGAAAVNFVGDQQVGTLTLGAGGTMGGDGALTIAGLMTWTGGAINGTAPLTISAAASLDIAGASGSRTSARALHIDGNAALAVGGDKVLVVPALDLGASAKLDLADNALVVDYDSSSPLSTIASLLSSGFNAGAWNGNGINSSTASVTPNRALGYAESADIFTTFPANFAGQTVDDTAVLVRYTGLGDADLNGTVNLVDFDRLAAHFNQPGTGWSEGNFNYDNTTNLVDFNALAANFNVSIARAPSASGRFSAMPIRRTQDDLRSLLS